MITQWRLNTARFLEIVSEKEMSSAFQLELYPCGNLSKSFSIFLASFKAYLTKGRM
jgi:hypothetical protein